MQGAAAAAAALARRDQELESLRYVGRLYSNAEMKGERRRRPPALCPPLRFHRPTLTSAPPSASTSAESATEEKFRATVDAAKQELAALRAELEKAQAQAAAAELKLREEARAALPARPRSAISPPRSCGAARELSRRLPPRASAARAQEAAHRDTQRAMQVLSAQWAQHVSEQIGAFELLVAARAELSALAGTSGAPPPKARFLPAGAAPRAEARRLPADGTPTREMRLTHSPLAGAAAQQAPAGRWAAQPPVADPKALRARLAAAQGELDSLMRKGEGPPSRGPIPTVTLKPPRQPAPEHPIPGPSAAGAAGQKAPPASSTAALEAASQSALEAARTLVAQLGKELDLAEQAAAGAKGGAPAAAPAPAGGEKVSYAAKAAAAAAGSGAAGKGGGSAPPRPPSGASASKPPSSAGTPRAGTPSSSSAPATAAAGAPPAVKQQAPPAPAAGPSPAKSDGAADAEKKKKKKKADVIERVLSPAAGAPSG